MVAASAAAVVVVASLGVVALTGDGPDRADDAQAAAQKPKEMSALAKRALAEIPGAQQVSSWQVLLPAPVGAESAVPEDQAVPADLVDAGPIDIGTRHYTGVTSFDRGSFPAWLYDGISDYEKHVLGSEEEGYPVGSTDIGVVVDDGPMRLACMRRLPEWDGEAYGGDGCFPAMVGGPDGHLVYEWGMGTDDFLHEGKGLELFHTDTFSDGSPRTVWIGGTYGTDVASVDLVATDGTTVPATVASGTLVPGDTMFWGTVDGDLAMAVTRDASGNVLEKHVLEPCGSPVDCEVR
jgi:hypothetical protein